MSDVDCLFLRDGVCEVSSEILGRDVPTSSEACQACVKTSSPQSINPVTASLVVMQDRTKFDELRSVILNEAGPGTELKRILSWFWSPKKSCELCTDRARKMNLWGVAKCRRRKRLIYLWLKQSAAKNGVPFVGIIAQEAIERAIKSAEHKERETNNKRQVMLKKLVQISRKNLSRPSRWTVAVTTAPRRDCTLQRCINSMRICGWEPIVFAEPGSTKVDAETIFNESRKGVWHNWIHSVRWSLENTSAEWILTVQDDSLFHPDTKEFIEEAPWPSPDAGFVSLYTPKHYTIRKDKTIRDVGINRIHTKSLWGACALVWPRDVLKAVVEHPTAKSWAGASPRRTVNGRRRLRSEIQAIFTKRRENPEGIANSDTAIGGIMNRMNRTMWFVDPSPVQHIARFSSIGHGGNDGRRNAWRIADHGRPLAEQVFPHKPIATP